MDTKATISAIFDHGRFLRGEIPLYVEEVDGPPVLKYYDGPDNPDDPIFDLIRQIEQNPIAFEADLKKHFQVLLRDRLFRHPRR